MHVLVSVLVSVGISFLFATVRDRGGLGSREGRINANDFAMRDR